MVHKASDRKGEQLTSRIWAHHLHMQLCQLHQRTSRVTAAVKPFGQGSVHKEAVLLASSLALQRHS